MSGGSLDYQFERVYELAEAVKRRAQTPLHRAFAKHLEKVAKAAHDLEWMLSGDTAEGDEIPAIKAVVKPADILALAIEEAKEAEANLRAVLVEAEGKVS